MEINYNIHCEINHQRSLIFYASDWLLCHFSDIIDYFTEKVLPVLIVSLFLPSEGSESCLLRTYNELCAGGSGFLSLVKMP